MNDHEFTNGYRAVTLDGVRVIETSVRVPDSNSPYGFVVAWINVEKLVTED